MIDRKLEPLIKRLMTKYLGELDDDDLVMFVVEHLKDHKGPQKLIEGLEPVGQCSICSTLTLTHRALGPGGRGRGIYDLPLAASNIREYGVWGRVAHREDDGRVKRSLYLLTGAFCMHRVSTPFSTVRRDDSPPFHSRSDPLPLVWM